LDIKNDSTRWATDVEFIGEIDLGTGCIVVLGNCRACRSTLAIRKRRGDPAR
jgi:hypothetical protein